jgi:PAS domain S-box-containing protein
MSSPDRADDFAEELAADLAAARAEVERVRAERDQLEASVLQRLCEGVYDGAAVIDIGSRRVLFGNAALASIFGFEARHLVGKDLRELYPAPESVDALLAAVRSGESQLVVDAPCVRADGSDFLADVGARPFEFGGSRRAFLLFHETTQRKAAYETLEAALRLNRQIIDSAQEGILVCNREFRIQRWNPRMEAITGLEEADILGRHAREVFPFLEEGATTTLLERAMGGELVATPDYSYFVEQTGRSGWARNEYTPLRDFRGQIIGVLGTVHEITERKRFEEELARQNAMLQAVLDTIPVMIAFLSEDGRCRWVNRFWQDTLGWSLADAQRSNPFQLLYPESHTRLLLHLRATSGGWADFEGRTREGRTIYTSWASLGLADGTLVTIGLDLSERYTAEERQQRLISVIENSQEFIGLSDLEGRFEYVNEAGRRLLGLESAQRATALRVHDCVPEHLRRHFETEVLPRVMEDGAATGESLVVKQSGETVPVDYNLFLLRTPKREEAARLAVLFADTRARKQAESEKASLEAQLLQAQKMEAIGQLAGGIAHDFNNLLHAILGNLDLVLAGMTERDVHREDLLQARKAGDRAAVLTRQLLAFSRRQVLEPTHLEINEVIANLVKMLRRVIGEHIELRVVPGYGLGLVWADRVQIEQVLMNLCVNARDAMPNGGTLVIQTESLSVDAAFREAHLWARADRYVRLSVVDDGVGMDAETMDRVFEPFFTTKEVGKGTGLGLATVYGIVHQHGGVIHVQSELGRGCRFDVMLPVAEQAPEASTGSDHDSIRAGTETILLAEDDVMVRQLAVRFLQKAGYTVLACADGEDALALFAKNAGRVQLAVLDVVMPRLGGRALRDKLREKNPELKVIFTSGYSGETVHTGFLVHENTRLLQKPYSREGLLRAVRDVLDV